MSQIVSCVPVLEVLKCGGGWEESVIEMAKCTGVCICKVLGTGPMQRKTSPGMEATAVITAAGGRAFLSGSTWDPGGRRRGTLREP